MKFWNTFLYFLIAILIIGTIGIWLPAILDNVNESEVDKFGLLQNCATYFITIIVAGCLELVIHFQNNAELKNKLGFTFLIILLIIISIATIVGISFSIHYESYEISKWIVYIGVPVSWVLWWISNWKRNDMNPMDALGGSV
ncbi:hypothetical protein KXJ69_08975 [Aureisphaera sp. CAU 1614]|uniref:DUF4293 family protein n=1 Tax=Halomarinibacterium sedimenti TaxID=2857106 RepID=A0A9X1K0A4_9FLAO|nr:hypothetical protein [Halomarinibacterium sedimenti]MBW2938236.1 hypothetical protein [Halomarinibacterium sedimenti]